ncbi:MAG: hypothetical protein HQ559_04730 [Lentisphaerae bacterium]|nr:hypothetical protein [Lentisphaerota bacterium]
MGQGGHLHITNASPYDWKLTYTHSYQMEAWDSRFPTTIQPGQSVTLYLEFRNHVFTTWTDDGGEATYEIQSAKNPSFTFHAAWLGDTGGQLSVDLKEIIDINPDWFSVPPPPTTAIIGWKHDGTVSWTLAGVGPSLDMATPAITAPKAITVAEVREINAKAFAASEQSGKRTAKSETASAELKTPIRHMASFLGSRQDNSWKAYWMSKATDLLSKLTLKELCLPGTHDSGTYDLLSPFAGPWATTQTVNLQQQLEGGIRCLDLRVGFKGGDASSGFILVHDTWKTEVTVKSAMEQVVAFLAENKDEFVLLDFHRFPDLGLGAIDYDTLIKLVTDTLTASRIVPPSDFDLTLEELWAKPGRVLVLWNGSNRPASFGAGVDQIWQSNGTPEQLEQYIGQQLTKKHTPFWAICAVIPAGAATGINVIPHIRSCIDAWFLVGNDWISNTNIISVDFFGECQIVTNCVGESYRRAAKKLNG